MVDDNKYDYSDEYTTYVPEESRGTLLDQIRTQVDRNMGRRHVYLNKDEQKEYDKHRAREIFESSIATLPPDDQYLMRIQAGYAPITEPDRTRTYDDIYWFQPKGEYEEGEVRLPNGLNISFVRTFGGAETKLLQVYREKDSTPISPQDFKELVGMDVNYQGDYDRETIDKIISNIQKLDKHAHKPRENTTDLEHISSDGREFDLSGAEQEDIELNDEKPLSRVPNKVSLNQVYANVNPRGK